MQELFDQIRKAAQVGLYWPALLGALSVPSACCAMGSPSGQDTKDGYIAWFDKWVVPKHLLPGREPQFTGAECYEVRCSVFHEASAKREGKGRKNTRYSRAVFLLENSSHYVSFQRCVWNGVPLDLIGFNLDRFVEEMASAGEDWLRSAAGTPIFERNFARFIRAYPGEHALAPFFTGRFLL